MNRREIERWERRQLEDTDRQEKLLVKAPEPEVPKKRARKVKKPDGAGASGTVLVR